MTIKAQASHLSTQTGECDEQVSSVPVVLRSPVLSMGPRPIRAFGQITYRRTAADAAQKKCRVVYALLVSDDGRSFRAVKRLEWNTEEGEIAGIDLIGLSPDGDKLAADFWLAEGDGVEHRPLIYDRSTHKTAYRPLGSLIQERINGCDQMEDFVGVTDSGEAIFAVPPSTYDASPQCGDKGVWHFDLATGNLVQAAKISGDKWR
jgi:hypothetical protein